MVNMPFGKEETAYKDQYDKNLLYPINHSAARKYARIPYPLPFKGFNIWNYYVTRSPDWAFIQIIYKEEKEGTIPGLNI